MALTDWAEFMHEQLEARGATNYARLYIPEADTSAEAEAALGEVFQYLCRVRGRLAVLLPLHKKAEAAEMSLEVEALGLSDIVEYATTACVKEMQALVSEWDALRDRFPQYLRRSPWDKSEEKS